MATRNGAISRRRLLASATAAGAVTFLGGIAKPYLSRAADRPNITHGIQSGDISIDSGIVWARTDRPARMIVEAAATDRFETIIRRASVDALPDSDFTAKALLEGLPAGKDIFYRVAFENLSSPTIVGLLKPAPIGTRQTTGKPSGGIVSMRPVSFHTPRRSLPRKSGQSSASGVAALITASTATHNMLLFMRRIGFMLASIRTGRSGVKRQSHECERSALTKRSSTPNLARSTGVPLTTPSTQH